MTLCKTKHGRLSLFVHSTSTPNHQVREGNETKDQSEREMTIAIGTNVYRAQADVAKMKIVVYLTWTKKKFIKKETKPRIKVKEK